VPRPLAYSRPSLTTNPGSAPDTLFINIVSKANYQKENNQIEQSHESAMSYVIQQHSIRDLWKLKYAYTYTYDYDYRIM
jgi:hypothetical protein